VTGRYFSLGEDADAVADDYVRHYYGDDYFAVARADTLTSTERLGAERAALERAGATDVLLYRPRAGSNRSACWPRPCGRPGSRRPATPDLPVGTRTGRIGVEGDVTSAVRRMIAVGVGLLLLAGAVVFTRAALWEGPGRDRVRRAGLPLRSSEGTISISADVSSGAQVATAWFTRKCSSCLIASHQATRARGRIRTDDLPITNGRGE
jgi:hypothetical protein